MSSNMNKYALRILFHSQLNCNFGTELSAAKIHGIKHKYQTEMAFVSRPGIQTLFYF